ncbi:hypothetical protein [Brevibacterium sp.]|uniref:hypothetical protein n=1 Tax=Brevibacterium sp. TaxID=1701 RepID=UPI00281213AE|nr:hypothetical protein [Brevibacterium sp.]
MEAQIVHLLFVKRPSPFEPDEIIDPLVGILADESECERFEAEHKDLEVSWEDRFVNDAEGHQIATGDTLYAYFYMAMVRETPAGKILDLLTDAAVEDVMYQKENAQKMLDVGDIQVMTVGDIRLGGDFPTISVPSDWETISE